MKGILQKLFAHRGIKSVDELSPDEKATFENYERVLSKETLTMEDFKSFLITQVGLIEGKWKDNGLALSQKAELIPYHTCYKTMLQAIGAPQTERETLERFLESQLRVEH